MLSFFALIVAMFVTMMLIPSLMRSAVRYDFVDRPDRRKLHGRPVPRIGGVAMVAGAVTPVLLWIDPNQQILGLLYGIAVLLVFGLWDDRAGLDYRIKFLGQILAVGVAVFYGDIVIRYVPFHSFEPISEAVAIPLSLFALLGVTNAVNLADGLDGLAGGTMLLSIGMLCLLAYSVQDTRLFVVAMALVGCIVGFLRYNTHPAQIFMGDAGSQFLGFTAGVLVIQLTQKSGTVLSPAMPLLLLGLPLIDTFLVIGQRIAERRSPFQPDRNHVHHKLLELGCDHYEAVVIIYSIQALLVTLAYVLRFDSDLLVFSCFVAALSAIGMVFRFAGRRHWLLPRAVAPRQPSVVSRMARLLKQRGAVSRGPVIAAALTIPVYAVLAIGATPHFPEDAALLTYTLAAAAVILWVLLRERSDYHLLERLLLYVGVTTIVFYWGRVQTMPVWVHHIENIYFALLGFALVVAYRFTRNRTFTVTPTDFLIIFIALIVPTLSGSVFPDNRIGEVAIKVLILFYAVELIVSEVQPRLWLLRGVVTSVLLLLALRIGWAF